MSCFVDMEAGSKRAGPPSCTMYLSETTSYFYIHQEGIYRDHIISHIILPWGR